MALSAPCDFFVGEGEVVQGSNGHGVQHHCVAQLLVQLAKVMVDMIMLCFQGSGVSTVDVGTHSTILVMGGGGR